MTFQSYHTSRNVIWLIKIMYVFVTFRDNTLSQWLIGLKFKKGEKINLDIARDIADFVDMGESWKPLITTFI